jgi:hypothetical protein
MAKIKISELLPVGYDLLNDAPSFLNELATDEVQNVLGGGGGWGRGGWGGGGRGWGGGGYGCCCCCC